MKKIILLFITVSVFSLKQVKAQNAFLKKGCTVALSEEYFKEMVSATSTDDRAYFSKLIKEHKIVILPKDTKVSVISSSALKGIVVARILGTDVKVWTTYEALKYEK